MLLPSSATLPAYSSALHRALIASAGASAFATATIAAGLLATSALAALVCAPTAAASIGVLCSSVACHMFLLVADILSAQKR